MISMFRNSAASILIIVLLVPVSCLSGRGRVRAVPPEGEYEICPVCKGSGSIETYSSKPPQKGLELTENEKGCADTIGCFFFFGSLLADDRSEPKEPQFEYNGKIKDQGNVLNDYEDESGKSSSQVERSNVKYKIKCERCDGIGWIKKYESSTWSMDSGQTSEGFNHANELLHTGKKK